MERTLISYLVGQYLEILKQVSYTNLDVHCAARCAGNHNRVNLLAGNYYGGRLWDTKERATKSILMMPKN
jgi:hypothetical protein